MRDGEQTIFSFPTVGLWKLRVTSDLGAESLYLKVLSEALAETDQL